MDLDTLWSNFLDRIKEQVADFSFETWFKESKLFDLSNNTATVIVPMKLHIKHLDENYKDLITKVFNELTGTNFKFVFKLQEDVGKKQKNDIIIENINEGVPYQSAEEANLNPNNTFENFIVGNSNKFAFVAAQAVAEKPGKAYNPLFLYSKSGLGKTHLMQAIGNYILKNSNKKVLYISSDKFVNDFINAVRSNDKNNFNKIDNFKNRYRNIDVLIIDDIQFLGTATKGQEEFFHTFNELYNSNKQIIIASDRSVDDLKMLENRLLTRFNWGLTANITPPDFELRMNIIRKKISHQEAAQDVPDNVIEYINKVSQSVFPAAIGRAAFPHAPVLSAVCVHAICARTRRAARLIAHVWSTHAVYMRGCCRWLCGWRAFPPVRVWESGLRMPPPPSCGRPASALTSSFIIRVQSVFNPSRRYPFLQSLYPKKNCLT